MSQVKSNSLGNCGERPLRRIPPRVGSQRHIARFRCVLASPVELEADAGVGDMHGQANYSD